MKMLTAYLAGAQLDYAVAQCEGVDWDTAMAYAGWEGHPLFNPSSDWGIGGPIIEREKIELCDNGDESAGDCWAAHIVRTKSQEFGSSALVAAMRCYVASKLGDEVSVPEELA